MRDEEKKIVLTHAENNPWYKFLLETIKIDEKYEEPRGWHWFCAFKDLSNVDLALIQKNLSKENPFKSKMPRQSFLTPELNDAVIRLKKSLNITRNIEEIDFSGLIFQHFDFSYFVFPIRVSFENTEFSESVNFFKAEFSRRANFRDVSFLSNADFGDAIFSSNADFENVIFSDSVSFHLATFSNNASFASVKFYHTADFYKTTFCSFTCFSDAIFFIMANFSNAIFSHCALFDNIKVTGHATFKNAEFKEFLPSFHKADMYSDIIWDESRWPILSKESDIDIVNQNKNAYENLASLMKKLDKYHDEHFFYRKEMQCRGWLAENPFVRFSYLVYETLANFGYGLERAFFWWALHIFAGIVFITATTKSDYCALRGSFANAHGFLFFHNGPLKGCYEHFAKYDIFNIIWGVQTVFGILFLFLLLLTVRIRFRLK